MLGAVQRAAELKPGTVINVAQTKEAKSMNADDANRVFAGEVRFPLKNMYTTIIK